MIAVEQLGIRVGGFHLENIRFTIPTGSYVTLMGKSGTGKTTLMEAICGLRPVQAGRIMVSNRDVTHRKAAERGIGYVPQDGALFMAMTVRRQLGFALHIRRWPTAAIARRVEELAALLGISDLLPRKPYGLSGGEMQRVALGRALAASPTVLCLDEPLSALDDDTRQEMYHLLSSVHRYSGATTLHITHAVRDAVELADSCLLLEGETMRAVSVESLRGMQGWRV